MAAGPLAEREKVAALVTEVRGGRSVNDTFLEEFAPVVELLAGR